MKKLIPLLGISFMCISMSYQANAQAAQQSSAKAIKTMTISCTVSADGKRIVSDKDEKSWTVTNPRVLKGHSGDHVSAVVQVDVARNAATVKSITVLESGAANTLESLKDNDDKLRNQQR